MRSGQPFRRFRASLIAQRLAAAVFITITATAAITCGGSTAVETVVGPDVGRCQTTLTGQQGAIPPDGGSVDVTINAARDCTWTATAESGWMQLNSTSGQGNATLAVTIARNELPAARSGAVAVNDQRFTISQQPRPCIYELRASTQSLSSDGGRGTVAVETLSGCTWNASSSAAWLQIAPASGNGSGTVSFEAAPNTSSARDATVTIAGQSVTITQTAAGAGGGNGPTCPATIAPNVVNAAAAGGTHPITIGIPPPCDWTATSSAPAWLTVAPNNGRGPAALTLTVARNTGAARSATISAANQIVTVNQAAAPACTATIDLPSASYPAAGGEGRVRVTTPDGCEWSSSVNGNAPWVQITNGRGTGNGEARYTVAANTATSGRSATLSIGGRSHAVSQAAAAPTCVYTLQPASQNVPAGAGGGTVAVTTDNACAWTATSNQPWLTTTSAGSGNGTVNFSVQANGAATTRQATVTVGSQSFTVTQDAAAPTCTYSISATPQSFGAGAGSGSATVTTQAGCAWTASAGAEWVTNGPWSGSGTQSVSFAVQANTGAARQTTIALNGGPSVNISQEAAAPTCTYSISASPQSFGASGGGGSVTVTTQSGCGWTASAGAGWVTNGPWSGSGTQTASFSVQANSGGARQTSISLNGGGSVNISQEAAAPTCTYRLEPTSQNFPASGGPGTFQVIAPAGCAWSATSNGFVTTSSSGSGNGTVSYSVQENTSTSPRQVVLNVQGQSFTVTQDAGSMD